MSDISVEDFLSHYGVRGMRWGVRRSKTSTPKKQRTTQEKQARAANIVLGAYVGTAAVGAIARDMDRNPQKYIRAGKGIQKAGKVSMKVVSKAAKGSKLIFGSDTTVFAPGVVPVGTYMNAGLFRNAIGS